MTTIERLVEQLERRNQELADSNRRMFKELAQTRKRLADTEALLEALTKREPKK